MIPDPQAGGAVPRRTFVSLRAGSLRWLLGLILAATLPARAESPADAVREARARVERDLAPRVPGLAVAAAVRGKILWSEGFGFADLEAKRTVTTSTLFRIGSISKPLTAAGLMRLVEQGRIDLDADIHRYLPDYPGPGPVITTRQLAGHLGGIRHYQGEEFRLDQSFANLREGLSLFENDPLLSKPGERYSYSSYDWNLIGAEMEAVSGQPFPAFMERTVLHPLGLAHTLAEDPDQENSARARFYDRAADGTFTPSPRVDNRYKWPSGGFLSTPEDLVKFGSALLHPGFLQRSSLDALFTSQKTLAGQKTGYGIGWSIRQTRDGHRIWLHTGGSIGGTSVLLLFPDTETVLAMTANCTTSPFHKEDLDFVIEEFSSVTSPSE